MASDYPGALDSFSNPTGSTAMNDGTTPHAAQHADANDAIEAIQATLGVDPQGSETTVAGRLDAMESAAAALIFITSGSFSAVSSHNVNGCFSSTYKNYVIEVEATISSAGAAYMRLRVSGSDATTNYINRIIHNDGTLSAMTSTTTHYFLGTWAPSFGAGRYGVYAPFTTSKTVITAQYVATDGTGGVWAATGGGIHTDSTSYDGFSLIAPSGTITGSYKVYGIADS